MKQKIDDIIKLSLSFLICLFTLLIPVFDVYKLSVGLVNKAESGFAFATFNPQLKTLVESADAKIISIFIGTLFWIIIVFAFYYVIMLVMMLLNANINKVHIIELNAASVMLSAFYMIAGICATKIIEKGFDSSEYGSLLGVQTLAFVPFIIILVLVILNELIPFLIKKYYYLRAYNSRSSKVANLQTTSDITIPQKLINSKKSNKILQENQPEPTTYSSQMQEDKIIEILIKYKKLLDEGIITEEEFTTKKKQLLGL